MRIPAMGKILVLFRRRILLYPGRSRDQFGTGRCRWHLRAIAQFRRKSW